MRIVKKSLFAGLTILIAATHHSDDVAAQPSMPTNCEKDLVSNEETNNGFRAALGLLQSDLTPETIEQLKSLKLNSKDLASFLDIAIVMRGAPLVRELTQDQLKELVPDPNDFLQTAIQLGYLETLNGWLEVSNQIDFDQVKPHLRETVAKHLRTASWYADGILEPLQLKEGEKAAYVIHYIEGLPEEHPFVASFFEAPTETFAREGITSHKYQVEIAKAWARSRKKIFYKKAFDRTSTLNPILVELKSPELLQVILPAAGNEINSNYLHEFDHKILKDTFPNLSREDQVRFFATAFARSGIKDASFIRNSHGIDRFRSYILPMENTTPNERQLFIHTFLKEIAPSTFEDYNYVTAVAQATLYAYRKPRGSDIQAVEEILFQNYPLQEIFAHETGLTELTEFDDWHIGPEADANRSGLQQMFENYARDYPDRLEPGFAQQRFWEPTRDSGLARVLIREYYDLKQGRFRKATQPKDTLDFVANLTGLDSDLIRDSRVAAHPGHVLRALMEIYQKVKQPIFEQVQFARNVFQNRSILRKFLEELNEAFRFKIEEVEKESDKQANHEKQMSILIVLLANHDLTTGKEVSSEDLQAITSKLSRERKALAEARISKLLKETTGREDLSIPKSWGSPEPLLTLLQRYRNDYDFTSELLLEMIEKAEDFKAFKFGKPDQPEKQIDLLKPDAFEAWTQDRVRLTPVNSDKVSTELLQETLDTTQKLISESTLVADTPPEESLEIYRDYDFSQVLNGIPNGRPLDVLMDWLEEQGLGTNQEDLLAILNRVRTELQKNEARTLFDYRSWARVGIAAIDALKRDEYQPQDFDPASLKEQFRQIARTAQFDISQISNEGIVFTTLSSDPMFMLTTGDLVKCTSCLNYRTGGQVRLLPSYIVDSNIRLLASFHLSVNDFENPSDYEQFFLAVSGATPYESKWDGNRRVLTLTIEGKNNTQIQTRPLEHASQRNIVRLGFTEDNHPSLRLEKTYATDHLAAELMREERIKTFQLVSEEMDALNGRASWISRSRNPDGSYSDALGTLVEPECWTPQDLDEIK